MTFYEQVRSFFKKYDPARIRLAKRIAAKYKTPKTQREVMKRLNQVYAAGGPGVFDFSAGKIEKPQVIENVAAEVTEEVEEEIAAEEITDSNDGEDNDELEEVTG